MICWCSLYIEDKLCPVDIAVLFSLPFVLPSFPRPSHTQQHTSPAKCACFPRGETRGSGILTITDHTLSVVRERDRETDFHCREGHNSSAVPRALDAFPALILMTPSPPRVMGIFYGRQRYLGPPGSKLRVQTHGPRSFVPQLPPASDGPTPSPGKGFPALLPP